MRPWLAIALVTLLLAPANAQTPPTPFRIGVVQAGPLACSDGSKTPAAPYTAHLKSRVKLEILVCQFPNTSAAAKALSEQKIDMVELDRSAFQQVASVARPILTFRKKDSTARIMSVALVNATSSNRSLATLSGARPSFAMKLPHTYDAPMAGLRSAGMDISKLKPPFIGRDHQAAVAALRNNEADFLVLDADTHRLLCRGSSPTDTPCKDLVEVWRGRPAAETALIVRKDIAQDLRYGLIGIHIFLAEQAPAAFAWLAAKNPGAVAIEPTEPTALSGILP
jgi:ABC-type phosphate/phosphonate transport system substrate-binding protein